MGRYSGSMTVMSRVKGPSVLPSTRLVTRPGIMDTVCVCTRSGVGLKGSKTTKLSGVIASEE